MNNGKYLKERGLNLVESNNMEFVQTMRAYARKEIKRKGCVSIDEVRAYADKEKLKPDHCNAFGSIFRTKDFIPVGRKNSQVPSNHSRSVIIWGAA